MKEKKLKMDFIDIMIRLQESKIKAIEEEIRILREGRQT